MARISNDPQQGLALSLAIYITAIGAAAVALGMLVAVAVKPLQIDNPGLAAYHAPPGTRLVPVRPNEDVALDLSGPSKPAAIQSRGEVSARRGGSRT